MKTKHSGSSTLRKGDVVVLNNRRMLSIYCYRITPDIISYWTVLTDMCNEYNIDNRLNVSFIQRYYYNDYKDKIGMLIRLTDCGKYWIVMFGDEKILCLVGNVDLFMITKY